MIATHNVKVNGRWIRAGERYGDPEPIREAPAPVKAETPAEQPEEKAKTKTTTRRKSR